jgi:hypothetical protein
MMNPGWPKRMTYFSEEQATPFSIGIQNWSKMKMNAAATPSAALDGH